jgi:hypothetical protein
VTDVKRANWIPAPAAFNLNMACIAINKAFDNDGYGCYLVGSALTKRDYRDVDVRFILSDDGWSRLFGTDSPDRPDLHPRWSVMCASISTWLQSQTGLPIDFQFQQATAANAEFSRQTGHHREPLGMFTHPNPRDYAAALATE